MHLQHDSAFRFRTRKRRVKTINFDVGKNRTKLFGYHSNVPWTTAKLMAVFTARGYAKRGICRRHMSVCVSVCVCVSVTLRYCIKTAKRRITQITQNDSPMTLVF